MPNQAYHLEVYGAMNASQIRRTCRALETEAQSIADSADSPATKLSRLAELCLILETASGQWGITSGVTAHALRSLEYVLGMLVGEELDTITKKATYNDAGVVWGLIRFYPLDSQG